MKKTFLTLLSTENYLKGVLVLHRSLLNTSTIYPFAVLLSERINKATEEFLQSRSIQTIRIKDFVDIETTDESYKPGPKHWKFTFEKLYMFNLTQFEKIVFLDSDMLVLENIDELFDKEHLSAVGPAGGRFPGNEDYNGLNSGLLVIEPNKKDYESLISLIPSVISRHEQCGDQDVIVEHFIEDWRKKKHLHLDDRYNMIFPYINYYTQKFGYTVQQKKSVNNIKVVHFIGTIKPWMQTNNIISDIRLWFYYHRSKILNKNIEDFYETNVRLKYKRYLLTLSHADRNQISRNTN